MRSFEICDLALIQGNQKSIRDSLDNIRRNYGAVRLESQDLSTIGELRGREAIILHSMAWLKDFSEIKALFPCEQVINAIQRFGGAS